MTETNMTTSNPYDTERRAGTVGFLLPGVEVKITDPETGAELSRGEAGMIYRPYYKNRNSLCVILGVIENPSFDVLTSLRRTV